MQPPSVLRPPSVRPMDVDGLGGGSAEEIPEPRAKTPVEHPPDHDNTTLLHSEESFTLAPVDATNTERKCKLIVDELKKISGKDMKHQISDTSDIVSCLDLAPPPRRFMHWKETGGLETLLTLPAKPIRRPNPCGTTPRRNDSCRPPARHDDASRARAHEANRSHTVPVEPLPLDTDTHAGYQPNLHQMTNQGYEGGHHSPQHDYDLPLNLEPPPSVPHPLSARPVEVDGLGGGSAEEIQEREVGETEEHFNERVLNRRVTQLFTVMRPKLATGEKIVFSDLAPSHNSRKQAAQKFYSLLALKKKRVLKLEVEQEETDGPLLISKGVQFETEDSP